MSASKSNYPSRSPVRRPKKPNKGSGKPSSEHIHSRRKTWSSRGSSNDGRMDTSPREGQPWWKSPLRKELRSQKREQLARGRALLDR